MRFKTPQTKAFQQTEPIEVNKQEVLSLWDSGSTVSLIHNKVGETLHLNGKPLPTTCKSWSRVVKQQTNLFCSLQDQINNLVQSEARTIDEISRDLFMT